MRKLFKQTAVTIVLAAAALACSIPGFSPAQETEKPAVALSSPTNGQTLPVGQETKVQSVSVDVQGVARVELLINGQVVWADANAKPESNTPFIVAQPWTPDAPGKYLVQARAYNTADIAGQSEPVTVNVVANADIAAASSPTPEAATGPTILSGDILIATPTATRAASPSPTYTAEPTAETPAPTPTAAHTATPTPEAQNFSPTGLTPDGRFKDIWIELGSGDSRLGYPAGPEIKDRNYAKQFFEKGVMLWWDTPEGPNAIWVLDSPDSAFKRGGTSNRYDDTWDGGDDYSCDAARSGGPVRGFGKVWCEQPELQARLGLPSEPEAGSGGSPPYAQVQFFQGGMMFYNPANKAVYVVYNQGDWERFIY